MKVSIEQPTIKFLDHFEKENNSRILFSGKFGTGKSYFLRNFFASEKNDQNIFWISPINYVVGTNQDIFEWIKVDLAKQLITEHLTVKENTPISKNFLIQSYLYKNAGSIFERLISVLSNEYLKEKTGISLLDTFKNDIDEYKMFEKSAKEEFKPDFEKLQSFLSQSFQIKGSIYEDDITTQIIRVSLEVLKLNYDKKQNVLIIDDLDRLDPEHIFRILNILSAHNDHFDSNKFGFDKVIIACDYDAIENLYKHKYGTNTDFEGYIEKFYTYEPFYFSINDSIVNYCQSELGDFNLKKSTKNVLSLLLVLFYIEGHLRIRNLSKATSFYKIKLSNLSFIKKYKVDLKDEDSPYHQLSFRNTFTETNTYEVDYNYFEIIKGVYLLSIIFGGIHRLSLVLKNISRFKVNYFDHKYLEDIFESLCIPAHLGRNLSGNKKDIFVKLWDIGGDSPIGIVNMDYPRVDFFGINFRLPLKWNNGLIYKGGNYFEDASPISGLAEYASEKEIKMAANFSNLIDALRDVVELIKKEDLFLNTKN